MLIRGAAIAASLFLILGPTASAQTRARFPAWDTHVHLGGVWDYPGKTPNFTEIVASMKAANIEVLIDFKAGGGIDSGNKPLGIWGPRVDEGRGFCCWRMCPRTTRKATSSATP
jgi:hypothetical protein